jgi:magnesium chelatase family protein
MTMRGYHKLLKVSRTIADLENSAIIKLEHVREALFYRSLDRTLEQMKSKTM